VIVAHLHPESPFARAGIEVGDVIREVDGLPVNTPPEMIFRMSVAGLGAEARVRYFRDGREEEVTVSLIAAPDLPPRDPRRFGPQSAFPGLSVETINPAVAAERGLPSELTGVLITEPGPVGVRVGLLKGDVVQAVNGVAVNDSATLEAALRAASGRLALGLLRQGRQMVLRLRL
jgi:S1-C subfamily serine protease